MKIVHVIHSLDPRSGGPSHALRGLVAAQVRAGHDVAIVATTIQSAEPWQPRTEYVRVMHADPAFEGVELFIGRAFGRRRPWSRYAYTPECRAWLRERCGTPESVDVMHVHGSFCHLTSTAMASARRHRIPYVIRPAGSLNDRCLARGRRFLKRVYLRTMLQSELNHAARVHAMSTAEREELRTFVPPERIEVVPHGMDVPVSYRPDSAILAADPTLAPLVGQRYLLFLGRLHEKKRPDWVVRALASLEGATSESMAVFAGTDDGALVDVMATADELGLSERILSTGFVTGDRKTALLRNAAAFVLPSVDENYGVAVLEALAAGVPTLVTPGVASHVHVDAGGGGLTVADDPSAWNEGVRAILESDRRELGERGRSYVREHLSWEAVVDQTDAMYAAAIDEVGHPTATY